MYVCIYACMYIPQSCGVVAGSDSPARLFLSSPTSISVSVGEGKGSPPPHDVSRVSLLCHLTCGGPIPLARMSVRELFKAHLGGPPPITQSSLKGGGIHVCLSPYIHI